MKLHQLQNQKKHSIAHFSLFFFFCAEGANVIERAGNSAVEGCATIVFCLTAHCIRGECLRRANLDTFVFEA